MSGNPALAWRGKDNRDGSIATGKGILVNPRSHRQEIERLESASDLPVGTGSVNMGSGLVGAGLVANSHGYVAGLRRQGMNWDELKTYLDFWSDFMENKTFEVKGTFKIRDEWLPYAKVIEAPNETQAQERTFALMGSKHRLKRRYIKVQAVNVIDGE